MITYPISSNYVKISCLQCYRLYNFPFFRSNQWRCYNRKIFCGNFTKFTGKRPQQSLFFNKLQAEATASDLSRVYSWRFLVYFIPTEKWDEKKGNILMELKYLLFCSSIDFLDVKDFQKNLTDGNLIRKCV